MEGFEVEEVEVEGLKLKILSTYISWLL